MYRHATMRLRCHACSAEQPLPALMLSPLGGHLCWRCDVRAQIAGHEARARSQLSVVREPRRLRGRLAQLFGAIPSVVLFLGFCATTRLFVLAFS
jgi:hypothetical protein